MIRLTVALLALAALAGCGIKAGLEKPPPAWGEARRDYDAAQKAQADAAAKAKADADAEKEKQKNQPPPPQTSPTSPPPAATPKQ